MSEVTFLASLGMRMLLSAAKRLDANKAKIALLAPQPLVREALESAGFDSILPIEDELDKALALLSGE
jgi:anti-anti-sigma factor